METLEGEVETQNREIEGLQMLLEAAQPSRGGSQLQSQRESQLREKMDRMAQSDTGFKMKVVELEAEVERLQGEAEELRLHKGQLVSEVSKTKAELEQRWVDMVQCVTKQMEQQHVSEQQALGGLQLMQDFGGSSPTAAQLNAIGWGLAQRWGVMLLVAGLLDAVAVYQRVSWSEEMWVAVNCSFLFLVYLAMRYLPGRLAYLPACL